MRRDSTVFILGEDVAEAGTPFKVLSGPMEEFGNERALDTPISEAVVTCRGQHDDGRTASGHWTSSFGGLITLTMDQIVNEAAEVYYISVGMWQVPMVTRTTLGSTRRSTAQHFAIAACLALPHSWAEGRASLYAVRRQGPAESVDPRRQPGPTLRGQDDKMKGHAPEWESHR